MNGKIRQNIFRILLYILIGIVLLVFLVPLCFAAITAIKTPVDFLKSPISFSFAPTFENFTNAWAKASFGNYILNSLIYTGLSTVISLFCALLLAFPIARKYIKFSKGLLLILMMGMFLPDGTIPLFQIFLKLDLYNTMLGYIISTLTIGGVPLIFFVSYLKSLPKELDEAAIMDGAGYFRYFFKVVIPLSKPAISSMAILTAIGVWNDIAKAVVFLSDEKLYPITKGLFVFSGQYSTNWTELTAALVIVSLPLIILYLFMQRYIIDGLTAGAVKM